MPANWFIAIPVDPAPWFADLTSPPPGLRAMHPTELHITVAFLGPVSEGDARHAWSTLAAPPAFDIRLGTVEAMGPPERYSALAALIEAGREPLEAWIRGVRDPLLGAADARPDRYGVKAHCTVARPARGATEDERAAGLRWAASLDLKGVGLHLAHVALYTWAEDRTQRHFRIADAMTSTR